MKYALTVILFLLTACGAEGPEVEPDLSHSVARYLALAPNAGHWDQVISIDWGETGEAYGHCHVYQNKLRQTERKVRIDRILKNSGATLDAVVAHELAHCLHDKEHAESGLMSVVMNLNENFWGTAYDAEVSKIFE